MNLIAEVPHEIAAEATYVLDWVFGERFGLPKPRIQPRNVCFITITIADASGRVRMPCLGGWAPAATLAGFSTSPSETPATYDGLTILFGRPGETRDADELVFSFDLFGAIFWCLTRVEELETDARDKHGRFAASQSYLSRHELLCRPIVDEIVDFLWHRLRMLWPGLIRKVDNPSVRISCDVDVPYSRSLRGMASLARGITGDLLLRGPLAACRTLQNAWRVKTQGDYSLDPNNNFAWMMDQCEAQGLRAAFYFIAGNHAVDPRYDLSEPFLQDLLCSVARRGHEIGMHGSYVTYLDLAAVRTELSNLRSICDALRIDQTIEGNRQHYLRWDARATPDVLADAGFAYDTSLGFADRPGFRCGTCHPFPLWSWRTRTPRAVLERPLIVMEATVLEPAYMGLDREAAGAHMLALKRICRKYGGDFSLLWHNSYFADGADREVYLDVLKG